MARNVEIKARIENIESTRRLVSEIADLGPEVLRQKDTFFQADSGRLKLRECSDGTAELIYYDRPDQPGPKESQYQRSSVSNPDAMRDLLTSKLGVLGVVRKKRVVYWAGRTRIHLDEVQDLGNFLELEVVLIEDEPLEASIEEANHLMERLEIDAASLVSEAYIDLLRRGPASTQT